jgi:Cft2 family RNA processing exonuclease
MNDLFSVIDKSVYVPAADLYLDAGKQKPYGFISHAHSDHLARHKTIICTPETAQLLKIRLKGTNYITLPYGQPYLLNQATVTLLPAGHILGSAQIFIETAQGTVLYTGDFRLKHSRTAAGIALRRADVLIMESTFGLPHYLFPPRQSVEEELLQLLRQNLAADITPVVFAYSLGKSQEVLHLLGNSGLPVAVHETIVNYARIYEKHGINFGKFEKFRKSAWRGKILLMPTQARYEKYFTMMENKFTIYLSGWGIDAQAARRFKVDRVLPYSDHADFGELIEFARQVQPDVIFCTHGFEEFIITLRAQGFDARPLLPATRIDLIENRI